MTPDELKEVFVQALGNEQLPQFELRYWARWLPLDSLLRHLSQAFMSEHVLCAYLRGKQGDFCASLRLFGAAQDYVRLFERVRERLSQLFETCEIINPYRFSVSGLPGFYALREYFRSNKPAGVTLTPSSADEKLLNYCHGLQKWRPLFLESIEDRWAKYLAPLWSKNIGFVCLRSSSAQHVKIIEYYSEHPTVEVRTVSDPVAFSNKEDVRAFVPNGAGLISSCGYFGAGGVSLPDAQQKTLEQLDAKVSSINNNLESPDMWFLRKLTHDDYKRLVEQSIAGERWIKKHFDLGANDVLTPRIIHLVIQSDKIAEQARFSPAGTADTIHVHDRFSELPKSNEAEVFHESVCVFRFWFDNKDVTPFVDDWKVTERQRARDTEGRWTVVNTTYRCVDELLITLREGISVAELQTKYESVWQTAKDIVVKAGLMAESFELTPRGSEIAQHLTRGGRISYSTLAYREAMTQRR